MRTSAIFVSVMIAFLIMSLLPLNVFSGESYSGDDTVVLGSPPITEWTQTYGGSSADMAYSVVQTADGGYAMAGYTNSFGAGSSDIWLVKTDSVGNMQWNKTYGGAETEDARSLVNTSDGGYALAGRTNSFGAGSVDVYLVKTDSNGNMQWNRTFGGTGWDEGWSMVQTEDGGYAILCYTESSGAGSSDFWLIRTNSNGNMLWNKTYGGASGEVARVLVQTCDGGYALVGGTRSFGAGSQDFWLIRTDSNGNVVWNKTYGGASWDEAWSVVQMDEGGYALAGFTESFGAGSRDAWLIETNSVGDEVWNKTYGGTDDDRAYSLLQTLDGGYAFGGFIGSFGAGGTDFWLVKTDSSGNMQWNETYGGVNEDYPISMLQTGDGGYAMAGGTYSYGAGVCDFWLVKITSELHDVAITEVTLSKTTIMQGQTMLINVTVENQGEYTETFNVTTYYNFTAIEIKIVNSLIEGGQSTLTFEWDTTGVSPGYYVIFANASVVVYETDFADNSLTANAVVEPMHWGEVTEVDGVTPVVGASVKALQEGDSVISSTTTDSQGRYMLQLSPGAYKLLVRANDHLIAVRPLVNVVEGVMPNVNFKLTRGEMIVFDDFKGTSLNASKWEGTLGGWGSIGNATSEPTKFSAITLSSMSGGGAIKSKATAELDSIIIFEGRISSYPGTYGDNRPRGLRVGTDPNNAIEFITYFSTFVKARTVASGVATESEYSIYPKTVGDWNLTYKIIVNSTLARFYVNDLLIAAHTTNIPTGPLNIYMGTHNEGGNVPVAADYLFMAKKLSANVSPSSVVLDVGWPQLFTSTVTGGTSPFSYQWYLNSVPVSGATNATWTFTPSSTDSYSTYVIVVDSVGVQTKSNIATINVPADPWRMFHHDLTHSGYSTSTAPNTNQTRWSYTTAFHVASSPAVVGGRVYVGSYDHRVYALNASTGTLIWSYTTSDDVFSSPAVVAGKVFVGSRDDKLYALNASTGTLIWSYQTGADVDSSPAVADCKVFVGSYDGKVYCLNASTGTLIWSYQTGGPVSTSSPAVADGKVYVGSGDFFVYALNVSTGALIWRYSTGGVWSSPAVVGGKVFVGSYHGSKVYCLNASTGSLLWSYTTGDFVTSSPAAYRGKVFVGSYDGKVYCLNASTGTLIWSYTTGGGVGSSPAVVDDVVFVGSSDYKVYAFGLPGHDVSATGVAPSRAMVTQGNSLNINVTVKNLGYNTETFNITLYANGIPMHTFINIALTSGSTTTLTIEVGFTTGFYTLSAYAWPVSGEIHTSDNTYIYSHIILVTPQPQTHNGMRPTIII